MNPDYTINDAFHDGFECGLLYILRYFETNSDRRITANDVRQLIIHLDKNKPWMTADEWEALILNNLSHQKH